MKFKYLFICLLCLIPNLAKAELQIDVVGAMSNPVPLAFPDMLTDGFSLMGHGGRVKGVISADLEGTGLFRILPENSYIQKFSASNLQPNYVDWRAINSHALIQTYIKEEGESIRVDLNLYDVPAGQLILNQSFNGTKAEWRKLAHKIADKIYERLTGEKGYFNTRIVYVSENGPANKRIKRLGIMDQDGENHRFLTDGRYMTLTPRFSPTTQKITYLSYSGIVPKVYLMDLRNGAVELVGHFPGMTFAPTFSPDGNKLVFSYAHNGNSEIYEMDLHTKTTKQLTNHPAIDTSPSYSPDGKKIVFNSDRGGNQQLYTMDADGSNVERISFGQGRYATPTWSPRGDYIAFTKISGGQFYIGVMYPDGSGERQLASGYLVEAPVWAPNGRVLMFFRQDRGGRLGNAPVKLYSIDITGYNERQIVTPAEASDPAWSPLVD